VCSSDLGARGCVQRTARFGDPARPPFLERDAIKVGPLRQAGLPFPHPQAPAAEIRGGATGCQSDATAGVPDLSEYSIRQITVSRKLSCSQMVCRPRLCL